MSFQTLEWARRRPLKSPSAKLVLLTLASYAGERGECFPSQARLAEDTAQSVDSVQRRLGELEKMGLLVRFRRMRPDGSRTSDQIVLLHDDEARAYAQKLGWVPDVARRPETAPDIEPKAADCGLGGGADPKPQIAGAYAADIAAQATALVRQHEQPNEQPESPPLPPEGEGEGDLEKQFDEFIAAYAPDKLDRVEAARRLFRRLNADDRVAAVRFAAAYVGEVRRRGKIVCYASTWLRDRGWEALAKAAERTGAAEGHAKVWVIKGSQAWDHWEAHYKRTKGIGPPSTMRTDPKTGRATHGWQFPTLFPPGAGHHISEAS